MSAFGYGIVESVVRCQRRRRPTPSLNSISLSGPFRASVAYIVTNVRESAFEGVFATHASEASLADDVSPLLKHETAILSAPGDVVDG